jgi:hypothetical protein
MLHSFKKYNIRWDWSKDWGFGRERKGNKKSNNVIRKDNLNFYPFFAKIKCFQSDLTEALAKLNQMPLALFRNENPGKNFLYIYIRMTGNVLSFYHLLFKIKKIL